MRHPFGSSGQSPASYLGRLVLQVYLLHSSGVSGSDPSAHLLVLALITRNDSGFACGGRVLDIDRLQIGADSTLLKPMYILK